MPTEFDPGISRTPQEVYQSQFTRAKDRLYKAFQEREAAEGIDQKQTFDETISRSLQVLEDAARALGKEDLLEYTKKLREDLDEYRWDGSEKTRLQFESDLKRSQRNL